MAIGDDWTIDYTNRMVYHDSGTTIYEMWELYSWIMDEIDETGTIDDTVPMTAQTPTAYTLVNSWYINENEWSSFEFLKGGALKTDAWDADANATGIRRLVGLSSGWHPMVVGDIGATIAYLGGTPTDTGKILDYNNSTYEIWVRVDDTGDTFANTATAITVDGATSSLLSAASTTGEELYANIYTLGTLRDNTDMYVYQNNSKIAAWWIEGHIDVLVKVKQAGALIDYGTLTILARQYSTLYENFSVNASSGGRIPIPIGTADDLNNDTGYRSMALASVVGDYTVGEKITGGTSTAEGIITAVTGSPTTSVDYYLIGTVATDFSAAETVTGADSGETGTSSAPADTGPNTGTPATITATFGTTTQDLSNGYGNAPYSVIIDCQQERLSSVYERLKYLTRRGASSDIDDGSQSVIGEQYEATGDYYIPYDTLTVGVFTEGGTISSTDQTTFSGTITSNFDRASSDGFLIVRNVSGTVPVDGENLTDDGSGALADVDTNAGADPVTVIAQTNDSPFGTFAGGKFFGARGVWITDYDTTLDSTNFVLIDSEGILQTPPNNVPITVSGVVEGTRCYVVDTVPTTHLNKESDVQVGATDEWYATTTLTYSSDLSATVRAREMGYLPFETSGTISSSGLSVTAVWLQDPNFKLVVSGESITFADANPDTITRAGNFATDGWIDVMSQVTIEGSTSNDGTYEIAIVAAGVLTLEATETLTAGTDASGVTLTFTRRAPTW